MKHKPYSLFLVIFTQADLANLKDIMLLKCQQNIRAVLPVSKKWICGQRFHCNYAIALQDIKVRNCMVANAKKAQNVALCPKIS